MSAWTLINHQEINSTQKSIVFNSIPQTGTDLMVFVSSRGASDAANDGEFSIQLNGVNVSDRTFYSFGSGTPGQNSGSTVRAATNGSGSLANIFGAASILVTEYASSTVGKNVFSESVNEANSTSAAIYLTSGLFGTSPVTSLTIIGNRDLAAGTSVTLYMITKGSSGGVTVS